MDYRIELKARNNRILRRMNDMGIFTVAELCRRIGVSNQTVMGNIINMTMTPYTQAGEWREQVLHMAELFQCLPDDLFSPAQREMRLKSNKAYIEASEVEVEMIMASQQRLIEAPDDLVAKDDVTKALAAALSDLPPKWVRVLELRFGLNGEDEHTLEAAGQKMDVTRERIRQMEIQALRKLKRPTIRAPILDAMHGTH